MEDIKDKASILLSIFKRKGGEGLLTKLITDDNKACYSNQLVLLKKSEKALLSFKEDDFNWLLLTNNRVIENRAGEVIYVYFSELLDVSIAILEEYRNRIVNKEDFTILMLKDNKGSKYLLKSEKGKPFQGLYQVLHYIATSNKRKIL